ncbi:MAG: rod shape-determining protein RodA [Bacteroidota bacterium]
MAEQRGQFVLNIDFITFWIYLALVAIGGIFIYSVDIQQSGTPQGFSDFLFHTQAGKQVIWIGICLVVFAFIIFLLDHKFWPTFAYGLYALGIVSLVLVLVLGTKINGATSWFTFGGVSIQPSELAKVGTCLGVAAYLGHWSIDLRKPVQAFQVIAFFVVPSALVLLQPDAGSALVFLSFFIVLFREGLTPIVYVIGLLGAATFIISILFAPLPLITGLCWGSLLIYVFYEKDQRTRFLIGLGLFGAALWWCFQEGWGWYALGAAAFAVLLMTYRQYTQFRTSLIPLVMSGLLLTSGLAIGSNYVFNDVLKPHQQQRIDVWLRPSQAKKRNPDSVMNLENSMLAIGAGGVSGRGVFSGRLTQGRWVPAQNTDFIFCTIGEEQGFVGSVAVVSLYLLLLFRIIMIAERQKVAFNRVYGYGVAGIIFIHVIVNIGMTMGLMPIIGIPLPFLSKGGSSLLGFTILLAILLKLDKHQGRIKKPPILG